MMLENSFSFIPICIGAKWHLISDAHIATYLRSAPKPNDRKVRLSTSIQDAIASAAGLKLCDAEFCGTKDSIESESIWGNFDSNRPKLVLGDADNNKGHLLGLITAFDIL